MTPSGNPRVECHVCGRLIAAINTKHGYRRLKYHYDLRRDARGAFVGSRGPWAPTRCKGAGTPVWKERR